MTGKPERESTTEELERRHRELTILNAIAQALNREVDLDRTLRGALALVVDLLGLQTGWIWLFREGARKSYLAAAQNLPPGLAESPRRMEGSCYCLDTYLTGDLQGAANVNVVTCSRLEALVDGTAGLAYHASIPLYAHGKKLGVLNVASPDWRELSREDLRLLYTVGDLVSIAVERARLFARSVQVGARTIVFTAFDTDERILDAVRAGAQGYLLKGAPREEIFNAVRVVHTGGSLLQPIVASRLLRHVRQGREPGKAPELTGRELDVVRLLSQGLQNKEIGARLGISERTAKFHVACIMRKLGAANRTEIVALAAQRGLIEL